MKLELFHTEPSRMTLLNYGNTSSSSIWYEMEYIQERQKTNPLKKGHRIMQVAFGSVQMHIWRVAETVGFWGAVFCAHEVPISKSKYYFIEVEHGVRILLGARILRLV